MLDWKLLVFCLLNRSRPQPKYKPIFKEQSLKKIIIAAVLLIAQNAFRLQQSDLYMCKASVDSVWSRKKSKI